ncbi:hypothetical protein [Nocardioides sp. B-3]|uniref:hypothetical protein n=1 Tax=Nocardioides sp. B-3 TaxID=2895565 RepID=UPI0021538B7C|nr:hypothetical protein [Nocardioides sp. B-3]UUZ57618.1 hypothetical protein LP418_14225 [Nocardioides sp. B-3]
MKRPDRARPARLVVTIGLGLASFVLTGQLTESIAPVTSYLLPFRVFEFCFGVALASRRRPVQIARPADRHRSHRCRRFARGAAPVRGDDHAARPRCADPRGPEPPPARAADPGALGPRRTHARGRGRRGAGAVDRRRRQRGGGLPAVLERADEQDVNVVARVYPDCPPLGLSRARAWEFLSGFEQDSPGWNRWASCVVVNHPASLDVATLGAGGGVVTIAAARWPAYPGGAEPAVEAVLASAARTCCG